MEVQFSDLFQSGKSSVTLPKARGLSFDVWQALVFVFQPFEKVTDRVWLFNLSGITVELATTCVEKRVNSTRQDSPVSVF
jgi:hypothetical protein